MTSHEMRRKDRAISEHEAWKIVDAAQFMTVATVDEDGEPYVTPLSFCRDTENPTTLFFHSTNIAGQKLNNFQRDNRVRASFVLDTKPFADGLKFTTEFQSAIIRGTIRQVKNEAEYLRALRLISLRYLPNEADKIDDAIKMSRKITGVWAIEVNSITGKRKLQNK